MEIKKDGKQDVGHLFIQGRFRVVFPLKQQYVLQQDYCLTAGVVALSFFAGKDDSKVLTLAATGTSGPAALTIAACVVAELNNVVPVAGNSGTSSKATILIILIKGLTAGPAVSL